MSCQLRQLPAPAGLFCQGSASPHMNVMSPLNVTLLTSRCTSFLALGQDEVEIWGDL